MENDLISICEEIEESISVKKNILDNDRILNSILNATSRCIEAYRNGNKVILAGNGGSAADAQHIAAEFVSRYKFDRPGLSSIALSTDTSVITAIGNDYGFENLFERQIQAIGKPGDVFIAISTSGNSKNIINAVRYCNSNDIYSIGFCGSSGKLISLVDCCISVPSSSTPRIQESHILIGHLICGLVEKNIFFDVV